MLLAALEETGVAPGRADLVGDTRHDIEMARAAGVRSVGVRWGHQPETALGGADVQAAQVVAVPEDVVDDVVDVRGTAVTPRFVAGVVRYQGHSLTTPEIGIGSQKFHPRRVGSVQIRMKSEAVRFLSALCPKSPASSVVSVALS